MKILIINGPNLNFLGIRETSVYGTLSYNEFCDKLVKYGEEKNIQISITQTNYEGKIIDLLQEAHFDDEIKGIILNAGGYTHTSVAIRDAVSSINKAVIEVHLSDISKRETFRHFSYLTDVTKKSFIGKGINSYIEAIDYLNKK